MAMNTTGGRKVSKADLLELARALGDEEVDADESMLCIFQRALDRAHAAGAPATLIGPQPPAVVAWARLVLADADEHLKRSVSGDDEFKDGVYRLWVAMHVERAGEGRPRGVQSWLASSEADGRCEHAGELAIDRATGEETCTDCDCSEELTPVDAAPSTLDVQVCSVRSKAAGVPVGCFASHAHPNEPARCTFCDCVMLPLWARQIASETERRENAEQWAKTRGSKGGVRHA